MTQLGAGGWSAIAGKISSAVADDCADRPRSRRNLANYIVFAVSYVQVAAGIKCNASRRIQLGAGGRPAIAGVARGSVPGDRTDNAGARCNLADQIVSWIGDVQIAAGVDRQGVRRIQLGAGSGTAVGGLADGFAPPATVLIMPVAAVISRTTRC